MTRITSLKVMVQALIAPNDGPIGDSSLWVEYDGVRLLNQNDARPSELTRFAELGQVHAAGRNITPAFSVDRTWAAVDVGIRARVDGPGPLFFQANAGGRAPVLLQRYVVQENTGKFRELHQVEQLGYVLSLSVGMHFL